uniref:glutathione transferase n=1 Tax=Brachionus rotundiformis TaxID=96890 RepID=A0A3G2JSE5_9BILA|nr:glutathione S-transferase S8 [Brachionus rotundiformis]
MIKYRLVYFNSRGHAELIRFIFAYIGQEYEDFRIQESEWPSFKHRTVFGKLPVLEISDDVQSIQLSQSLSIARYLSSLFGIAGTTDLDKARADMIAEQLNDILEIFYGIKSEQNLEIRAEKENFFYKETLPFYSSMFERLFEIQKTRYVAANTLTYADLAFVVFWDTFGEKKKHLFEVCVICKAFYDHINNLPEITEWKKERPISNY